MCRRIIVIFSEEIFFSRNIKCSSFLFGVDEIYTYVHKIISFIPFAIARLRYFDKSHTLSLSQMITWIAHFWKLRVLMYVWIYRYKYIYIFLGIFSTCTLSYTTSVCCCFFSLSYSCICIYFNIFPLSSSISSKYVSK